MPVPLEMALAFAVGVAWFALTTLVVALPLPDSAFVTTLVVVIDVAVVIAIARRWEIPQAVTVGVASVVALDWYYIPPEHEATFPDARNLVALIAYLLMATLLGELATQASRRAIRSEQARAELADEQAALRRVATLVARETPPDEVFAAVTEELGRLLNIDMATMVRYDSDLTGVVVAVWGRTARKLEVGTELSLEGDNVAALVRKRRAPARIDTFADAAGSLPETLRGIGVRSSAGSPIVVAGDVWGVMVASSQSAEVIPPDTEARLSQFTDLTATAVANAQSRTELTASRARIVTAADDARRRIERDLHDGLQQRLVSLALRLRLISADAVAKGADAEGLREIEGELVESVDALRELSRGIHPAILAEGGLRPALTALGRRSPVPLELDITATDRLPEPVEITAYYVVSEFVTNTVKHAQASVVTVELEASDTVVDLVVRDDGVGGAERGGGTGLIGLEDRVHALGGTMSMVSPAGQGTELKVRLPLESPVVSA